MAAVKDDCGLGEVAGGNGRRLHLGIPEAVFVVRDTLVLGILTLRYGLPLPSWPPARPRLLGEGIELKDRGESAPSALPLRARTD